jgi:hypothetical protein
MYERMFTFAFTHRTPIESGYGFPEVVLERNKERIVM